MSRGVSETDTIAAVATPAGRGGVGIIRVSGPNSTSIARQLLGKAPTPRYATYATFNDADGVAIDSGLALFFPGPRSFTGEDVLELQGHGGPVVMDMLLSRVVSLGARLALPGEFSERAFLNGKIDLSQAEAIADLIDSVSREAAKGAMRSMEGVFSDRINEIGDAVLNLRMYVEAAIDFPEEEVDFLADGKVMSAVVDIEKKLADTLADAQQGALLREGISLAIIGRPNAGKSSLMNALTGRDSSIVTTVPGTTRDVVREDIQIEGIPIRLIDTAGIRVSENEVEIEGIRRALAEASAADQVIVVVDLGEHPKDWQQTADELLAELGDVKNATLVLSKLDLAAGEKAVRPTETTPGAAVAEYVSAKTGEGINELRQRLVSLAGAAATGEGRFIARRRHLDALERASRNVALGRERFAVDGAGELLAEELKLAHEALCEITGEFTPDDLLGKIFSSFCIGK